MGWTPMPPSDVPSTVRPPMPCLLNLADQSTSKSSWECSVTRSPVPTRRYHQRRLQDLGPRIRWIHQHRRPQGHPLFPSRQVGLQRIGLHPHPRSSRRVNIIFTFWSRTPHISFVVYFSASFLFLSLSCSIICRPFYYYFNYRQKKNRTYDLRDFFFHIFEID